MEHDPQVEQQQKGATAGQIASGGESADPGEVPSPAFPLQMQGGSELATAPPTEWTVKLLRRAFLESVKEKGQSYGEAVDSLITDDEINELFATPKILDHRLGDPDFFRMFLLQADVSALSVPGVSAADLKAALVRARCDPQRFHLNVIVLGYTTVLGEAYTTCAHGILFEFRGHHKNGTGLERIFNVEYPVSHDKIMSRNCPISSDR